jgi:1,4-dihydroxy-2-naphthoyl-CoA hydrolase
MIWKINATPEALNQINQNTLAARLGIEIVRIENDIIYSRMPVDERTVQPMGLLHGGASAALSETIGSMASILCLENPTNYYVVGIELNISHLSAAREAFVSAQTKPVRIGKSIHVWQTDIFDNQGVQTATSRLTVLVKEK